MTDPAGRPHQAPILSEFSSDPDMAGMVIRFVGELPDRVESLVMNWNTQNYPMVRREANELKGASTGFGFPSIGLAASRIESGLRGRSAEQIVADAARIGEEIRLLSELCSRAGAPRT